MNLIHLLRGAASRFPDKPALICRDQNITYAELDKRDARHRALVPTGGLRPGDRVAIQGTNTIELASLLLACFHAGLIAVPVNVRLKPAEIAYIVSHSEPRMCFTQPRSGTRWKRRVPKRPACRRCARNCRSRSTAPSCRRPPMTHTP